MMMMMGLVIYSQLQFLFCLFTAIYSFIISSKMIKADLLKKTTFYNVVLAGSNIF